MRSKFLLFVFLLCGGIINAQIYHHQDTINSLVITEYRGDNTHRAYLELTNMGDEPVQLGQFKFGSWNGGNQLDYTTGKTNSMSFWIPVDTLLPPGEAYVFASFSDYHPNMFAKGLEGYQEKRSQDKMLEYADFIVHLDENGDSINDRVTPVFQNPFGSQWGPGMNGFFIQQMFADDSGSTIVYDSIVVDQVSGMFILDGGKHPKRGYANGFDVAGVTEATATAYLIRKHTVKTGNLDFNSARGVGLGDSEWIPIPHHGGAFRDPMWTVGNHDDYNLDANTLESDVIDVDFANKTLSVPWGLRRGDDIMNYFEKKPGIGWEYVMGAEADSLTHAVQTGDQLLIYVCGDDLDFAAFDIIAQEPSEDANTVVPKANQGLAEGWENTQIETGSWDWPRITKHESGNDTIWGFRGGIPFGTRIDSLYDRMDKPSNADWEIVYASGDAKPDLAHGDVLKVTAQNGSVKEYYISVRPYRKNTDATLSSITWPDIPEFYKGLFGWTGDTIPGFGSAVNNYNVEVPLAAEGMPALVAKTSDTNAKLEVDRATSLSGDVENRTTNFTVTAEDDTTVNIYSVTLTKAKDPKNLQPYHAEPFISELVIDVWNAWAFELCNPGNQPLDLSDYMIACTDNLNPADNISETNEGDWLKRYEKYIPGYKWAADAVDWSVEQYIAQVDLAVNAIIQPGDVFVMGAASDKDQYCNNWDVNPLTTELDVQFNNTESECRLWENQWGEEIGFPDGLPFSTRSDLICLFKILNDSVKQGLKPATDPNDFELIDVMGTTDGGLWYLPDFPKIQHTSSMKRRPNIYNGNPVVGSAFGVASADELEWDYFRHKKVEGWEREDNLNDIGKHFFIAPTNYMSTVSSLIYKISEGYKSPQSIRGVTTGTLVADFLNNIIKKDTNQTLTLTSTADGSVLLPGDALNLNDTLTVLSADSTNMTKYVLNITEEGLSSNAVLTSNKYDIKITQQPAAVGDAKNTADGHLGTGSITGFEYGTAVQTVVNGVMVPEGATMTVVSSDGAYVPTKMLNFDTTYVTVTVNANTYFEVLAENGTTKISYQLLPQASESSTFVTSVVYSVAQGDLLIKYVPRGTNVQTFLSNVVPSLGASIKVVDKWGYERTEGTIADDDKLVVTSTDETASTVYYISKLATEYIQESTYLAYILSNVYTIDQVDYKIYGASAVADITQFYSRIETAAGATAVVVDKDGNEKTTGNLTGTDKVKVISADGKIEVMYTFGQLTNTGILEVNQIEIYPNPTNGRLNVIGVEKGQRIQVYNSVGTAIMDVNVESNHEIIKINDHPAGLYLIIVSDNNKLLSKYKAIKF